MPTGTPLPKNDAAAAASAGEAMEIDAKTDGRIPPSPPKVLRSLSPKPSTTHTSLGATLAQQTGTSKLLAALPAFYSGTAPPAAPFPPPPPATSLLPTSEMPSQPAFQPPFAHCNHGVPPAIACVSQPNVQAPTPTPFSPYPNSMSPPIAAFASPPAKPAVAVASIHDAAPTSCYNPGGPCSVERLQGAFDPLLESAMALHSEAAGKDGVQKGLHALYYKLREGELQGAVQEKLVRLVTAVETRNIKDASRVREEIIRTTTTGWVEGGTWQWALKHLVAAASSEAPAQDAGGGHSACTLELAPSTAHVISTFGALLVDARTSVDAKKCDEIEKRLEDLYTALRNGFVNATTCQQLVAVAEAVEQKDMKVANACLQEITKTDFQNCKAWLPAVKQLLR